MGHKVIEQPSTTLSRDCHQVCFESQNPFQKSLEPSQFLAQVNPVCDTGSVANLDNRFICSFRKSNRRIDEDDTSARIFLLPSTNPE